jgi:23S rRNA pseudouridine955/2504/2580 synthase
MKKKNKTLTAGSDDEGKRLDRVLRQCLPDLPLSGIFRLVRRGRVKVNNERAKGDLRLKPGDRIEIDAALPEPADKSSPLPTAAGPAVENGLILYRSENVLVLNKPYGALVHGPGSLEDLVRALCAADRPASLSFRPGPAHRLDRNTTGVQLYSLSVRGARRLAELFHSQQVVKIYCALIGGRLERPCKWSDLLFRDKNKHTTVRADASTADHGLQATTLVRPLCSAAVGTLVLFAPLSGRTHQLRAQGSLHGHPLPGDAKYGGERTLARYLLHNLCLAVPAGALSLPLLTAPFDRFETDIIQSHFGAQALENATDKARHWAGELLHDHGQGFLP